MSKTRLDEGIRWLNGHDTRYIRALEILSQSSLTRTALRRQLGLKDEQIARTIRYLQRFGFIESTLDLTKDSNHDLYRASALGRRALHAIQAQGRAAEVQHDAVEIGRHQHAPVTDAVFLKTFTTSAPTTSMEITFGERACMQGVTTAAPTFAKTLRNFP